MDRLYLDYAAATPLDSQVLAAMQPYFTDQFYNPSAMYAAAQSVRADIEAARRTAAQYLGARPAEIIFTAGGTEANNLAVHGVMEAVTERFPDATMLMSAIEHDSVLEAGKQYMHSLIPVTEQGIIDVTKLTELINDHTALISVMYVNNEIGVVQPIREIGRLTDEIRRDRRSRGVSLPLLFHTDAAQAANYLDVQTARLGVDLLTLNGGKIYGPKQSGLLYIKGRTVLAPLIYGGGQERNVRSGTENVPAIIGFAKALQLAQNMRHDEAHRLSELQNYFFSELAAILPQATINGSRKQRLPNNLHITIPGIDNERMLFQLDAAGIMAAAGSACSASSDEPSHVLSAIGLSATEARSSLRLTMGQGTDKAALTRTLEVLRDCTSAGAI